MKADYEAKVAEMKRSAEKYHQTYYASETFRGPSLYFHKRALEKATPKDFETQLVYVYAVLVSWGMHRMGKRGSKMAEFRKYVDSILPVRKDILRARTFDYRQMTEDEWSVLERIFKQIKPMRTNTSLVGNSKVMAHLLPRIVPPIDRQYTLKYLYDRTYIRNDIDSEWRIMRAVIEHFFIPVASDESIQKKASRWMSNRDTFSWDTSLFKVIDNLIIGQRVASEQQQPGK